METGWDGASMMRLLEIGVLEVNTVGERGAVDTTNHSQNLWHTRILGTLPVAFVPGAGVAMLMIEWKV